MSQDELLAKLFEQLMDNTESKSEKQEEPVQEDLFGDIDIEAIMKLGELLSNMNNKTDKNAQLLLALKPHLRPENRQKADNALKLLKILNILPLLKDSGIIDGFFN